MEVEEEAKAAIAALDGYSLNGSQIHVEVRHILLTHCFVISPAHFHHHTRLPVIVSALTNVVCEKYQHSVPQQAAHGL